MRGGMFAFLLAGFSVAVARADVTLVMRTRIEGRPAPASSRPKNPEERGLITTTYYKGKWERTEAAGGVTLSDGERVFFLNPGARTFSATTVRKMAETTNPLVARLDFRTEAVVRPGGKTKTILGKPAKNYRFTVTMKLATRPAPGDGGTTSARIALPTIVIQGEQWTTEAIPVAGRGVGAVPGVLRNLVSLSGQEALVARFATVRGFPLALTLRQSIRWEGKPPGKEMPSLPGQGDRLPVIRMTPVSLKEGPLPDSLFQVPDGYRQVPFEGPALPGGVPGGLPAGAP